MRSQGSRALPSKLNSQAGIYIEAIYQHRNPPVRASPVVGKPDLSLMNCGRLIMDKAERGKTPGWGIPPTLCLTSRNSASFPQWRFEKKPLSFLIGKGKSSHLKILQSILFYLPKPALKWNYSCKPHQLELVEFYESLTSLEEGKHQTPACSGLPYREERDPVPFSSTLCCERKETPNSSPLETSCTL